MTVEPPRFWLSVVADCDKKTPIAEKHFSDLVASAEIPLAVCA